jgi:hypothetical protein
MFIQPAAGACLRLADWWHRGSGLACFWPCRALSKHKGATNLLHIRDASLRPLHHVRPANMNTDRNHDRLQQQPRLCAQAGAAFLGPSHNQLTFYSIGSAYAYGPAPQMLVQRSPLHGSTPATAHVQTQAARQQRPAQLIGVHLPNKPAGTCSCCHCYFTAVANTTHHHQPLAWDHQHATNKPGDTAAHTKPAIRFAVANQRLRLRDHPRR